MLRISAIFIIVFMMAIAASAGAMLYLVAGLKAADAMIVAIAAFTGLAIYNAISTRLRDRADLSAQIADMSRGTADMARQVAELNRRTAAIEGQADRIAEGAAQRARSTTEALAAELGELSTLVRQLAETVALHELKFAKNPDFSTTADLAADAAQAPRIDEQHRDMAETIRAAIDDSRVDLYLQPIVTLPQRKVRFYEALTRLRSADGNTIVPADFLKAAEAGGLMSTIDKLLLLRSVQVVRRLQLKNREIGLFCNVAASTLNDGRVFSEILQFLDANRALASSLMLEFRQETLRAMGPLETEGLASLRELGFRFCMDGVTDLRMEPRDLGERGIRYVKVPAAFLLGDQDKAGSDIHAADLSDLLGRFGISLIAERIEAEAQVVDLLDYDVRFGQGFLFSQPRPVRAEALRGAAEADAPADEAAPKIAAGGSGPVL